MSFHDVVKEQVHSIIHRQLAARDPVNPDWITNEIHMRNTTGNQYPVEHNKSYASWSGWSATRALVQKEINAFDDDTLVDDRQYVLEGFKHLQVMYVIKRNGVKVGISIHRATDQELLAKADEKEKMGLANIEHASELRMFVEQRAKSA